MQRRARTVIVVGPYMDATSRLGIHGARRKLEFIVGALASAGYRTHVFDSTGTRRSATEIFGGTPVFVRPAFRRWGPIGGLLSIFAGLVYGAKWALDERDPVFLWVYNGYALETAFVVGFRSIRWNSAIILQVEDLPFTRCCLSRLIKNSLDWTGFRLMRFLAKGFTGVNSAIVESLSKTGRPVVLLPGAIRGDMKEQIEQFNIPFQLPNHTCGYAGGLTCEKGAHLILESLPFLPDNWRFVVCGDGPLSPQFVQASVRHPNKLNFLGKIDDADLPGMYAQCDALLNPHHPLPEMNEGIFPFKVLEYLATGRLTISTNLGDNHPFMGIILEIPHSAEGILAGLERAMAFYIKNSHAINRCSSEVMNAWGEAGASKALLGLLDT